MYQYTRGGNPARIVNWTKFNRDEVENLTEEICKMLHSLMNRPS